MSLHKWLSAIIKSIKPVYILYFYILSEILCLLGKGIKPRNIILFNSYGGKKFDDSPRAIFEAMVRDDRFRDWQFVWAFHNPKEFKVLHAKVIRTDSFQYFFTALRARIWITNSGIERGLDFKPMHTFYVNTWHGSAIKKMGNDIAADNLSFKGNACMRVDLINAQNAGQADIFSRVFHIPRQNFLVCGYPRNDRLCKASKDEIAEVRTKLNIPKDKIAILYAPTFREFERNSSGCILHPPIDLKKWHDKLSDRYVLLFRVHYEVAKSLDVHSDSFIYDVTEYPHLNDLMMASDILISDYSSIFFDYSLMGKPMIHFCYDYDKYKCLRGMYFDIRKYLDGRENESELLNLIQNLDWEKEYNYLKFFQQRFLLQDGNATAITLERILDHIKNYMGVIK